MCDTLLGKKLGMTQVWSEDDQLVPVTVIQAGPCTVTQLKSADKEGYEAVQIGFGTVKENKVNQPTQGHFKKSGVSPCKYLREVRVDSSSEYELGQKLTVEEFNEAKSVDVSSVSKGKGFAGVQKRYNFQGGPGGHGAHFHRAPGSVGECATPSRVYKGKRLPGHMGVDNVTVKNLKVVKIDAEQNLMLVKGAVPGGKGALLRIRAAA
ncbi:MAG: 50S ribosomal protein L3 [Coriobacteriales bacterium]|jgi:large subunit ribosomal protein L3|nr:50S ribosomal protein L3 [Coriobacteriales bacterium]